jgi:hypothetical protein
MPWAIHPKIIARLKQQIAYGDDDGWNLNKK